MWLDQGVGSHHFPVFRVLFWVSLWCWMCLSSLSAHPSPGLVPLSLSLFPCLHFWLSLNARFTASQPMTWQIGSNHFLVGSVDPVTHTHIQHKQKANGMISFSHTQTQTSLPPLCSLYVNMLGMCCISIFLVKEQSNPSVNRRACWETHGSDRYRGLRPSSSLC